MRTVERGSMGQSWRCIRLQPQLAIRALVAVVSPLAVLLPLTVLSASSASAAPAAGYTAELIPTGQEGFAVAVDSATNRAYMADLNTSALSVINGSTNSATDTIALGAHPHGIAVDPATDTVYVSVVTANATTSPAAIDVIDGATNTVTDTIALPAGSWPIGVAFDSATDSVYVADYYASAVTVIDGSTHTVAATVSTGGGTHPREVAVDDASNVAWVADSSGNLFGINGTSNTVTQTVSFAGGSVGGVDVNSASDTVYAAIASPPGVAVINGSTGTVDTTISVTEPIYSVAVDPGSGTVFASSAAAPSGANGTTWVIDASSNAIVDTIQRGGLQIAVNTATGSAYVAAASAEPKADWVFAPSTANAMSPIIQSTSATLFSTGVNGSFTMVGTALPAATYSETGPLPSGVTLSPSGVLSGTPAGGTAGVYPITITASNGIPPDYSQAFTLTVEQAPEPPAITSADQTTFHTGVASGFTLTATGYPQPTFSEIGTLPAGVTLSAGGLLFGTPASGTAGVYPIQVTATNSVGTATQTFTVNVEPPTATFVPSYGGRVLDTRNGSGAYSGPPPGQPLGPGQTLSLQITDDGVPATGVTAVVLNVTATGPTASSYLAVYPDGQSRPVASNLNFTAGQTIANLVTVPMSADGKIDFYNRTGSVALVADLQGYYTTAPGLTNFISYFVPAGPSRMLDTRNGTGGFSKPVGPRGTISLQVAGADGMPATGVSAVVLNVTATNPTDSSFVTVYPDGLGLPPSSNLNFTPGETIANLVTVPVGADGKVEFYNNTGNVNLVADLAGYYTTAGGSTFASLGPSRVLDTRNGTGGFSKPVGPGGTISLQVNGANGIPAGATAVVLNVTAVTPTASGYVTVYPDGKARPTASNLNFTAGETIPNLVVVPVGSDGKIDFYNNTGSVNLIADLAGYFVSQ